VIVTSISVYDLPRAGFYIVKAESGCAISEVYKTFGTAAKSLYYGAASSHLSGPPGRPYPTLQTSNTFKFPVSISTVQNSFRIQVTVTPYYEAPTAEACALPTQQRLSVLNCASPTATVLPSFEASVSFMRMSDGKGSQ
jgi:hypothetical protein